MKRTRKLRLRVFKTHSFPLGGMGHVVMCCHCKTILTYDKMTVEHVRPKALGGTDELTNLLPSCAPCNNQRPCEDLSDLLAHWFKSVWKRLESQPPKRRRNAGKLKRRSAGKRVSAKKPKKKNVNRKWFVPNK